MLSFPQGTKMFQFPWFASAAYVFSYRYLDITPDGFPHSEIPGSKPVCGSPRLIAAHYVLHRLPMPRHPPSALSSLTIKLVYTLRTHKIIHLPIFIYQRTRWSQFAPPDTLTKQCIRGNKLICCHRLKLAPEYFGGGERIRTDDLLRAKQALSQLSYTPQWLTPAGASL